MKSAVFGEAEGDDLLFVMGWSNRLEGENERWFIDRLANEGIGYTRSSYRPTSLTSTASDDDWMDSEKAAEALKHIDSDVSYML